MRLTGHALVAGDAAVRLEEPIAALFGRTQRLSLPAQVLVEARVRCLEGALEAGQRIDDAGPGEAPGYVALNSAR